MYPKEKERMVITMTMTKQLPHTRNRMKNIKKEKRKDAEIVRKVTQKEKP